MYTPIPDAAELRQMLLRFALPITILLFVIVANVRLSGRAAMDKNTAAALAQPFPHLNPALVTDAVILKAQAYTERSPSTPTAWNELGDAIAQKQRDTNSSLWYEHAQRAYEKALTLDPSHIDALNGIAWVYGGRHDFEQSVRWAKTALQIDPNNPTAYGIIGDAALELGDLERAFESYQQMMDQRPDLASYSRGAYLVWITGDSKKARWLMQKAIDCGSPHAENSAWCSARLAIMLFNDGALLPAAQVVEKAVAIAPDHVPLLLALGRIKTAQMDDAAAIAAFEKILSHGPHHEALVGLGDIHAARGRAQEAETYYAQVESLHAANVAQNIHDHSQMARFYADHDRHLDLALKLANEHAQSQNVFDSDLRAWVQYKSGDFKSARKSIQQAMQVGTPDPEIHYHAGLISAATGNTPSAKKLLAKALNLNPRFHPLHAHSAVKKLDELTSTVTANVTR